MVLSTLTIPEDNDLVVQIRCQLDAMQSTEKDRDVLESLRSAFGYFNKQNLNNDEGEVDTAVAQLESLSIFDNAIEENSNISKSRIPQHLNLLSKKEKDANMNESPTCSSNKEFPIAKRADTPVPNSQKTRSRIPTRIMKT